MAWRPTLAIGELKQLKKLIFPSDADRLAAGLDYIGETVTPTNQFQLLRDRACEIYNRQHRTILARDRDVRRRILGLVEGLRRQVHQIHEANQNGADPNVDDHDQYCTLLRQTITLLNLEIIRQEDQIAADVAHENNVIRLDLLIRDDITIAPALALHATATILNDIHIFEMGDIEHRALVIPRNETQRFKTYQQLRIYISTMHFVLQPDLWIRLESQHTHANRGCRWEHAEGTDSVNFQPSPDPIILDVVNREKLNRSKCYIVAVVEEGLQGPEIPIVLDLPDVGEPPCCNPPCGNLGKHLETLWPRWKVLHARRFSEPNNATVLATDLVHVPFRPRTNDLYLTRVPAQDPAQINNSPPYSLFILIPWGFLSSLKFPVDSVVNGSRLLYGHSLYLVPLIVFQHRSLEKCLKHALQSRYRLDVAWQTQRIKAYSLKYMSWRFPENVPRHLRIPEISFIPPPQVQAPREHPEYLSNTCAWPKLSWELKMVLEGGTRQAEATGIVMALFAGALSSLAQSLESLDKDVTLSSTSWLALRAFLYGAIMLNLCGAFLSLVIIKMCCDFPLAHYQRAKGKPHKIRSVESEINPWSRQRLLRTAGMTRWFFTVEESSYWVLIFACVSTFATLTLWVNLITQADNGTWSRVTMGFFGPCAVVAIGAFGIAVYGQRWE